METHGNISLLDRKRIGFLAGSKIASLSVLPVFDWASEVARCDDIAIVSGFHSPLERQVLDFLFRGKCGIVYVLARNLYKKVPAEFNDAFNNERVLFVTEETLPRPTKETALHRNNLVISLSDELVVPKISPDSSLFPLISSTNKKIITL